MTSADGFMCQWFITDQAICGSYAWVFRDMLPTPAGETWALTEDGLQVWQGGGWVRVPIEASAWDWEVGVYSIALGRGEVWVASWPTVFHGGLAGWTEIDGPPGLSYPNQIAVAPNGDVWVAASDRWEFEAGLARFDGERWATFFYVPEFPYYPTELAIAPDGTVWVGSWRHGVASFDGTSWTAYPAREHRALLNLTDLTVGPDGAVWAASDGWGLSRFDGTTWTTWDTADGLASNYVESVSVASDGTVWIGTVAGVQRFIAP